MCDVYQSEVVSMTRRRKEFELEVVSTRLHDAILEYRRRDWSSQG